MYKFVSFLLTSFVAIALVLPVMVDGQVRTSTNYKIERDSLNIGGGFSTSTSYQSDSSIGEVATGVSGSEGDFATVEATTTSATASANTSHTVALPSGIQSGELLVVFFNTGGTNVDHTTPTDWTLLSSYAANGRNSIFWRIADGTEGTTLSVTTSGSRIATHAAYRISGVYAAGPIEGEWQAATSADPPNLTPSWGAKNTLWITFASSRRTDNTFSAPSGYGAQVDSESNSSSGSTSDVRFAAATQELNASSDDPATWGTTGTTNALKSGVLAVRPALGTTLRAGYQQSLSTTEYISISSPTDITMDSINGLIGGVSTSSVSWTVTTNSNAGYSASVKAATSPALASPLDAFADYVPATSEPDYNWSVAASSAEFGYSVLGADTVQRFKDDGGACNVSTGNVAEKCWDGFSTSDETIAQRASANDPSGTLMTLELRAEAGADRMLTADDYTATLTVTAVAL